MLAGKQSSIADVTGAEKARPNGGVAAIPDPQPGRHFIFGIVSLALLMMSVDQTIVATALGTLQHDLHTQVNWSSWTITVYALGRTVVLPIAGSISDLYGPKRVFLVAIAVFTAASFGCGLANDIYTLILLRAVQSIGGGALMPPATGIVASQYGRQRDRALGSFTSIVAIGGIIGPIFGGMFVTYFSWRAIFYVNVPIGIALFVLTVAFVPEVRRRPTARVDIVGSALLGTALLAAMLSLSTLGSSGTSITDPVVLLGPVVAIVATVILVRRSSRVERPVISARLLRGRGFAVLNTINFMWGSVMLGFGALVPLYAQRRYGVPTLGAGTLLTARAVGVVLITSLATFRLHRTGYRRPIFYGFMVGGAGLLMMSITPIGMSAYTWLAIGAGITGFGMGAALPASNVAVLNLAEDDLSSVAGLRAMFRQGGGIVGVSIVSAIVARSSNPGVTLGHTFVVFAVLMFCLTPLVLRIPERPRRGSTPGGDNGVVGDDGGPVHLSKPAR